MRARRTSPRRPRCIRFDDLDTRVSLRQLVDESVAAIDRGLSGRVVSEDTDLAGRRRAPPAWRRQGTAAAALPVAAVVTGIGLAMPEPKAITGILAFCAFSSRGMTPFASSASTQRGRGFPFQRCAQERGLGVTTGLALGAVEGDAHTVVPGGPHRPLDDGLGERILGAACDHGNGERDRRVRDGPRGEQDRRRQEIPCTRTAHRALRSRRLVVRAVCMGVQHAGLPFT